MSIFMARAAEICQVAKHSPLSTISLAALAVASYRLLFRQYVRLSGEPPLISGIPWIGCAIQFGVSSASFLQRMQDRFGTARAFTVFIAGMRMTFLPTCAYSSLYKSRAVSFDTIAVEFMQKVFGFADTKRGMVTQLDPVLHRQLHQHLQGAGLPELNARFAELLCKAIESELGHVGETPSTCCLYKLTQTLLVRAGLGALFWELDQSEAEQVLANFRIFDQDFALLAGGVPPALLPSSRRAFRWLVRFVQSGIDWTQADKCTTKQSMGSLLKARFEHCKTYLTLEEIGSMQVVLMWAAHANTGPAAFWALALLLNDPAALRLVTEEVRGGGDPLKLPLLTSACDEALRLYTMAFSVRDVLEDTTLQWPGGEAKLRRGDRVMAASSLYHFDAALFGKDNSEFRFDRFMGDKGISPVKPFGGGSSMCPGRYFAKNEMRILVAELLRSFDWELLEGLPGTDETRGGIGVLPPVKDMKVSVRRAT